jgi:transcriptional regulator with XRE-family HTH domain
MGSSHTPSATGSMRQCDVPNAAGAPVQRSFRGVIRATCEGEGSRIVAGLMEDLDSTGYSDEEIAERTPVGAAQLSRIRTGQAHPPGALIAWAIEQSRHRPPHVVVAICAVAEGEFKPRPPPSVEERHAATLDVLHEMGIGEVVVERVARKLGAVKP